MDEPKQERPEAAGSIIKVSGPLVVAQMSVSVAMYEVIYVGRERLIGEVIELSGERASIQVYEETAGLGPGAPVYATGHPLRVELGPGLIGSVFDGIQRPLERLRSEKGDFVARGLQTMGLDRERTWRFEPRVVPGQTVGPGDILGVVQETAMVEHRVPVPLGSGGKVEQVFQGELAVNDPVVKIAANGRLQELFMLQGLGGQKGTSRRPEAGA